MRGGGVRRVSLFLHDASQVKCRPHHIHGWVERRHKIQVLPIPTLGEPLGGGGCSVVFLLSTCSKPLDNDVSKECIDQRFAIGQIFVDPAHLRELNGIPRNGWVDHRQPSHLAFPATPSSRGWGRTSHLVSHQTPNQTHPHPSRTPPTHRLRSAPSLLFGPVPKPAVVFDPQPLAPQSHRLRAELEELRQTQGWARAPPPPAGAPPAPKRPAPAPPRPAPAKHSATPSASDSEVR